MKSSERHELHQNALLELLRNPRELAHRYGLTAIIVLVTATVAIYFIFRAAGAEQRKWQRAWAPYQAAVSQGSEEQLQAIAADGKTDSLVRSWAYIRYGELLYNKSQQPEAIADSTLRSELLNQAVGAFQDAGRIGAKYRGVVGQATVNLGLCYENLEQPEKAIEQYDTIIKQPEKGFDFTGTVWLAAANRRKALLAILPEEKVTFRP